MTGKEVLEIAVIAPVKVAAMEMFPSFCCLPELI